jgi:hypothetical protein
MILVEYKTYKDEVKTRNIRGLNIFFRRNEKKHKIINSINNFE